MSTITKAERAELLSLIKKRERVMKTQAAERSAVMLADFEAQAAKVYHFDEDEVWKRAYAEAEAAAREACDAIAARCQALGIPAEFAPGMQVYWHGRGQNAIAARRAELRRAAKARIDAIEHEALTRIECMSLEAQTELIAHGLQSDAAKSFLSAMSNVESLMPPLKFTDISALIEARHADQRRLHLVE